jgi:hypothetical protein
MNAVNLIMILVLGYIGYKFIWPKVKGAGGGGGGGDEESKTSQTNTKTSTSTSKTSTSGVGGNAALKDGKVTINGKSLEDFLKERMNSQTAPGKINVCVNGTCRSNLAGALEEVSPSFANF